MARRAVRQLLTCVNVAAAGDFSTIRFESPRLRFTPYFRSSLNTQLLSSDSDASSTVVSGAVESGIAEPGGEPRQALDPQGRGSKAGVGIGIAVAAIGTLFGSISLLYPFGRDQALYYYVAREWLRAGALPYRDAFDQKTPGIYWLHALLITIFGEGMWPIRLAEWSMMIPFGLAVARLATPKDERTSPLLYGLGICVVNVFYFGFFNFWDSAQCEIWCGGAIAVALYVLLRSRLRLEIGAGLAGALCAFALVMKPPSGLMGVVVFIALIVTAYRTRKLVSSIALFAAGGALVVFGAFLPFVKAGAMSDVVDVLVHLNKYYVEHDTDIQHWSDVIQRTADAHYRCDPVSTLVHLALAVGFVRSLRSGGLRGGGWQRYALPMALIVAGLIGVVSQLKFYHYHFGLLVAGEGLAAMTVVADFLRQRERAGLRSRALGPAIAVFIVGLAWMSQTMSRNWAKAMVGAHDLYLGSLDRDALLSRFNIPGYYELGDAGQVARWLRDHSNPGDRVLVRGFEPEIYAISGLSYGGRFFWDDYLVNPRRAYRRDEWLVQDRADLERVRPRWIVAYRMRPEMPNWRPPKFHLAETYEDLGYNVVMEVYGYSVMERIGPN